MRKANISKVFNGLKPLSNLSHPMEMIRQFTPNWFAMTMGTGVISLVLKQLPVDIELFSSIGAVLWIFNITLFIIFSILYFLRWIIFSHEAQNIFGHNIVSMFIGTIPMGLSTIINGFLVFGIDFFGDVSISIAQYLWFIDIAMSVCCGVLIPYLMFTRQEHAIDQMTAVWLLPVVAAEVAAVSGGLLATYLPDSFSQFYTLIISYALWAYSVPVAFSILVILILRLALHKLPNDDMAASSWLALGPIATGGLGMLIMGKGAPVIFTNNGLEHIGNVAEAMGFIAGITMWGLALWWMLMSGLVTLRYLRKGIPFNLGWWGYTFPLGVYSLLTLRLGTETGLNFFYILGGLQTVCLIIMWFIVFYKTMIGAWKGSLFVAPCITYKK